jgi:DnaK suppressor protein
MSTASPRAGGRPRPRAAAAGARALTAAQLRELEAELLRERARMERALAADGPSPAAGGLSVQAPPNDEGGFGVALEARAHGRYEAIVEALERMRTGSYGHCMGCQEPVPYGRLIVMPEARHCIACGPRA